MKKYISELVLLILIVFAVMAIMDYPYSAFVKRSNYLLVESWREILEGNIDADVVAVGSSRTWAHVNPTILDSTLNVNSYNLGFDGSPFNRQALKYEMYRKRNSKPKVIIQNIDAWTLGFRVGYKKEQFFPFFWDADMRALFFPTEPFTFCEKYIPFFRYHGIHPVLYARRFPRSLYKGYQGVTKDWNGDAFRQQKSIGFTVNDTTLCMFEKYLEQAKEEDVKVVFVYAPQYYGVTKKITNIDEMQRTYESLADKYDIPILDYSDMWISQDTTYFYNAMHLNKAGAEIFSDSLANGIMRLGVL